MTTGDCEKPSGDLSEIEAGIFCVDKPEGPSSFRMVQQVRRAIGIKKTGHAGTLDPFASGLLVICSGRPATRLISRIMAGEKEYEATICLGTETDTLDPEGEITAQRPIPELTLNDLESCLAAFTGEQQQVPPVYSALKHKGKPLYYYARRGEAVERPPRLIKIHQLDLLDFDGILLAVRVRCSKGTYIRTLAADIGAFLGCGAHLARLRRTGSGFFSVKDALPGADLFDVQRARSVLLQHLISVEEVVDRLDTRLGVNGCETVMS